MHNKLLITAGFCFCSIWLLGQIEQPRRYEASIKDGEDYYTLLSANENGLVLFRETKELDRKKGHLWEMIKLDTALNEEWKYLHYINITYQFLGYDYSDDYVYLLFKPGEYKVDEWWVLKINLLTKEATEHNVKRIVPITLRDFSVFENIAIFVGQVNYRPAIIIHDFVNEKTRVLPGIYGNQTEIVDVKTDPITNTINVIINERGYDRNLTFTIKSYNKNGELLRKIRLNPDRDISLLDGVSTILPSGIQFVAGTYTRRRSKYSRGMFIARLNPEAGEEIVYYNYADFKNFFKYMKKKRENRVKNRIARRREKGKKLKFNYKVLMHEIIERDGNFIALGEAYYPRYYSQNRSYRGIYSYGPGYNPSYSNYNFDGFRYTHAVVLGFDKQGIKLWDNSFEINDVVSYQLEQYVNVSVEEDKIVLLYNFENNIKSKIIQGNEVLDGKEDYDIRLQFEQDKLKKNIEDFGGLEYWYHKNFFAYGVQKIQNTLDADVTLNREVFFINKITYN